MQGYHTDSNGNIALMPPVCDMSQLVAAVRVPDETSAILADHSMQYMLIKFGMCYLVVLDDGAPLNLNYNALAKRNHKGFPVEYFHHFLNKSVTIAAEDRGTNNLFLSTGVTAGYASNSVPIDGIDILRSVPAIGRKVHFPLKMSITFDAAPKFIQNNAQAVLDYLKLTASNRYFSSILKILIEDRQSVYAERIKSFFNLLILTVSDIVMA